MSNFEKEITIGIKTFIRPKSLKFCLMRFRQRYKNIKILVADDSTVEFKKENKKLCQKYNAEYYELPYDVGIGYGRNQMIMRCLTKYFLMCDDDTCIDDRFDLEKLYNLIENTNLDMISCQRGVSKKSSKHYYHYFHSVEKISNENYGKYIIKYDQNMIDERLIKNDLNLKLYQTHLINESCILMKSKIIKNNLYENDIKIGQHQLQFSKLYLNNVKIGYCPDIIAGEKVYYPEYYLKFRGRKCEWIKPDDIVLIKI